LSQDPIQEAELRRLRTRIAELEALVAKCQKEGERAAHLVSLIDAAGDAIISKTISGLVQTWNKGAEHLYGYSASEMIGRDMTVLLPPDRSEEESIILQRLARGERVSHFDTVRRRKDGRSVRVSLSISPIAGEDGSAIGASQVAREINTGWVSEHASAHLAAIVESSDDAIISKDLSGVVMTWNKAAERLYGYTAAEMMGRPMALLLPPDRPDEEAIILDRLRAGERVEHFETVRRRKDGKQIDVSLTVSPIHDKDGTVRGASHVARDISERRHLETQRLHTQKLESLGVLAGGVAHDFNNLLTGILGNASLVVDSLNPSNPSRRFVEELIRAAERAAQLTRQLLAYAGKGRFVTEAVNLSVLVREISALVQTSIPRKVQVRLELTDDLPLIEADTGQMQQVVMNLVINGAEAMGDNVGLVVCTTGAQMVDEAYMRTLGIETTDLKPGKYVTLEVHDSGCGMDEATIARIFDPFFTTKFTGRGLGLAAVLGIVRGHKGSLKVYSSPGKGSTFKLLFPALAGAGLPVDFESAHRELSGSGTVLIVDDEETVRSTARNMLQRYGYRTIEAKDGREAVEIFQKMADEIALVLLDLTMPYMSGEEVLRELKTIKPTVRVLLSSGFNEVEAVRRFTGKGLAGFLQKPYTSTALAETVKGILGAKNV
jgi:PAS domain S-box-containing protein